MHLTQRFSVIPYRFLLCLLPFLMTFHEISAQDVITHSYGEPCVGVENVFTFTGDYQSTVNSWSVDGGTIVSGGGTTRGVRVRWSGSGLKQIDVSYTGPNGAARNSESIFINDFVSPTVSISIPETTFCEDRAVNITAAPQEGGDHPTYYWYVDGSQVAGQNGATFPAGSLSPGSHEIYVLMASSMPCKNSSNTKSNTITVNLTPLTIMEPEVIVYHPNDGILYDGCRATFQVKVSGATGNLTYKWKKGNAYVTSSNENVPSDYLALSSVNNGDKIECEVFTDASCYKSPVYSKIFTVSTSTPPAFTVSIRKEDGSAIDRNYCKGEEVTFYAKSSHTATYRWFRNGSAVQEGGNRFTTTATSAAELRAISVSATTNTECLKNGVKTDDSSLAEVNFTIYDPGYPTVSSLNVIPFNTAATLTAGGAGIDETYRWYTSSTGGTPLASTTTGPLTANATYYVSKYVPLEGCEGPRTAYNITVNKYPVANAGEDRIIVLPTNQLRLSGSGSDPDGIIDSYKWEKDSGPSANIGTSESAETNISGLQAGIYVFKLTVRDNYGFPASDQVTVEVQSPPYVNAGADRKIILPTNSVSLRGRVSDADGTITYLKWSKESGPDATIVSPDNATTDITDMPFGIYVFKLTATDNHGHTKSDLVRVIVQSRPVVSAGEDITVVIPAREATITANATDDDGEIVSYSWDRISGSPYKIANDATPVATLTGLEVGSYLFRVTVTDNDGLYAYDEVTVEVVFPANNYNYITTSSPQVKGIKEAGDLESLSVEEKNVSTTYFDGLGRPMQSVIWQASPDSNDIVQPVQYDAFGRQVRNYLPYSANEKAGDYYPDAVKRPEDYNSSEQFSFYQKAEKVAHDSYPYAESFFEPSPLNRILEQGSPGEEWQLSGTHKVKFGYRANTLEERVINWKYLNADKRFGEVAADGYYPTGQLFVNETENEDKQLVRDYTDKQGRVVLKDVRDEKNEPHYTYYVYDDFSNLRAVLQPAFKEAWEEAGGSVEDPVNHPGYKEIKQIRTIHNTSEGTKYYIRRKAALILGMGFSSGRNFHGLLEDQLKPLKKAVLNDYVFTYHYDQRQRMVEKQVPGGGVTYMVYDQLDRLVLSQDEEQREDDQWVYTKYDQLNRPVLSGLWTDSEGRSRLELQADVNKVSEFFEERDNEEFHGYTTSLSFPQEVEDSEVLTVTYYDDYTFSFLADDTDDKYAYQQPDVKNPEGDYIFNQTPSYRMKGQVTGSKTKVLGPNEWLQAVSYYDEKYRPLQVISQNNQGGIDRHSSAYDFSGKVTHKLQLHQGIEQLSVLKEFSYDHMGRLSRSWQTIAKGTEGFPAEEKVLLAENEYNALGELIDKKLHSKGGEEFKQSVDYRYNIRGWVTSINNSSLSQDDKNDDTGDFFGMELAYTEDFNLNADKLNYNGNISAIKWSANMGLDAGDNQRAYTYSYDGLNRIKTASFHKKGMEWAGEEAYKLDNMLYDKNGNIINLSRKGADGSNTDILSYDYKKSGNRLYSVTDGSKNEEGFKDGNTAGDDYSYYKNGNLKEDKNKGISLITYNHLNLPQEIVFKNGEEILYTYDAAGNKLSQLVLKKDGNPKLTEYVNGMVYEDEQLQFVQHEEGRVVYNKKEEQPFEYQYHLKDHLGNVRMSFTSVEKTDIETATLETASEDKENSQFLNYEKITKINADLFDHTDTGGTYYSQRLSGAPKERIGLAKSLEVVPGDVVSAEVFAKYLDPDKSNWKPALAELMTSVAGGAAGVVVDGTGTGGGEFPFAGLLAKGGTNGVKSYLNIVIFDKKFTFIDGGFIGVGPEAKENGTDVAHQHLKTKAFTITQPGFVYVWLSNENEEELTDVFFDDLSVIHKHSPVFQADDYYPFGLTFNSYVSEKKNNYLYNGMELQEDLGLDWYMPTEFRTYDATIGRFMQIDPVIKEHESPYAWNTNNPILYADPMGADSTQRAEAIEKAKEYVEENPGNSYGMGAKGAPGEKVDCSGMVSGCVVAGGEENPNTGNSNGVSNIADNTEAIEEKDVELGNIVILNGSSHTGLIVEIERDENGNIYNMTMIDSGGDPSSGKSGPRKSQLIQNGEKRYWGKRIDGYRKWDTRPDVPTIDGGMLKEVVVYGQGNGPQPVKPSSL